MEIYYLLESIYKAKNLLTYRKVETTLAYYTIYSYRKLRDKTTELQFVYSSLNS